MRRSSILYLSKIAPDNGKRYSAYCKHIDYISQWCFYTDYGDLVQDDGDTVKTVEKFVKGINEYAGMSPNSQDRAVLVGGVCHPPYYICISARFIDAYLDARYQEIQRIFRSLTSKQYIKGSANFGKLVDYLKCTGGIHIFEIQSDEPNYKTAMDYTFEDFLRSMRSDIYYHRGSNTKTVPNESINLYVYGSAFYTY